MVAVETKHLSMGIAKYLNVNIFEKLHDLLFRVVERQMKRMMVVVREGEYEGLTPHLLHQQAWLDDMFEHLKTNIESSNRLPPIQVRDLELGSTVKLFGLRTTQEFLRDVNTIDAPRKDR